MATTDKATLLGWIVTRWKPTVAQFKAFAESYWHKDEKIPTSSIDGLDNIMNGVATEEYVSNSIAAYGEGLSIIINELNAKVGIVGKTHAEISTMVAEGSLTPGVLYKITDRGDRGIILRAIGASQLSPDGIRLMLCPSTYAAGEDAHGNNWIGVWHADKTATYNCLAIWGGHVWRNLSGDIGSFTGNLTLDDVNWQLVAKSEFANYQYSEMAFGCSYSLNEDRIVRQWDSRGNLITALSQMSDDCSWTDWNMTGSFQNNTCGAIFNNSCPDVSINGNNCPEGIFGNGISVLAINLNQALFIHGNNCADISRNKVRQGIYNNNNTGVVQDNTCISIVDNGSDVVDISFNDINGSIEGNSCPSIYMNSCNGDIKNNIGQSEISNNSNNGIIFNNDVPGGITYNQNDGDILLNSCGTIQNNRNAGRIYGNTEGVLSIAYNFNSGDISGNYSASEISHNHNSGSISQNACGLGITNNSNGGDISDNTASYIKFNANTKSIDGCAILDGFISNNRNGGVIRVNSSSAYNVYDNFNNGDIQGTISADVFDVRANKP